MAAFTRLLVALSVGLALLTQSAIVKRVGGPILIERIGARSRRCPPDGSVSRGQSQRNADRGDRSNVGGVGYGAPERPLSGDQRCSLYAVVSASRSTLIPS